MADETTASPIKSDPVKPDPVKPDAPIAEPAPAPAPSAPELLRSYEDHLFGPDCVRIRGQIERGYGSKFKELKPGQRRLYDALEKLVATEKAVTDAREALLGAESAHAAAEAEASAASDDARAPSEQ
jgi:hypothetical protein